MWKLCSSAKNQKFINQKIVYNNEKTFFGKVEERRFFNRTGGWNQKNLKKCQKLKIFHLTWE